MAGYNRTLASTIRRASHENPIASTVMAEGKRSRRADRLSDGVKRQTKVIRKASIATAKPYDPTIEQRKLDNARLNEKPKWQPLAQAKVSKAQQRRLDAAQVAQAKADAAYWAKQKAAPKVFKENELRDK